VELSYKRIEILFFIWAFPFGPGYPHSLFYAERQRKKSSNNAAILNAVTDYKAKTHFCLRNGF
jgi:hypothetical protein